MVIQLKLEQITQVIPPDEKHWNENYKFEVEIAGEKIKYVFCPQTFLDRHGNGSKLGYSTDGRDGERMIFVAKNLHYAQVPFVALYLFYQGLENGELNKRFGDQVNKFRSIELNEILLGTALGHATEFLRVEEMSGLINRFKEEPSYNLSIREIMLKDIIESYISGQEVKSIVISDDAGRKLYTERAAEYAISHHFNKYTRRSRNLSKLVQNTSFGEREFGAYVVHCEYAYTTIKEDKSLRDNLPAVIKFLDALRELEPGTEVEIGPQESKILYAVVEGREKSRTVPVLFRPSSEVGKNLIVIRNAAKRDLTALTNRLRYDLEQDRKDVCRMLEGIDTIVKRVGEGDTDARTKLQTVIETYFSGTEALVPVSHQAQAVESMTANLQTRKTDLEQILTRAPDDVVDLTNALHAKKYLERLGMDTEKVNALISSLVKNRTETFKQNVDTNLKLA